MLDSGSGNKPSSGTKVKWQACTGKCDLSVYILAMTNFHHEDYQFLISDRIDDSVLTLSNAVLFLTRKLLAACRTWIFSKLTNAGNDTLAVPLGADRLDFLYSRWLDEDAISCHGAAGP